jgi:hypothetical protein
MASRTTSLPMKDPLERIPETNKVPGLPYIFTDTGLELPVLDITHPLFEASIDEKSLADQRAQSSPTAAAVRAMPEAQRKMITEHSYIWGIHFSDKSDTSYLSGMGTYMLKLGPQLLGGGKEREIDRRATMGVSGIAARMRLRDLCRLQTEILCPLLAAHPGERLCLINIGGGAAADTFNTLRLVQQGDSKLLQNRRIEIHLLEVDTIGPHFAQKSLAALQQAGGDFENLDLDFRFHQGSWADETAWEGVLKDRDRDIVFSSSEGGLFEYGRDEDIRRILETLAESPSLSAGLAGSCLLDRETIDPTITALAEISGSALRFLGRVGLEDILAPTSWSADWFDRAVNPVYLLFSLRKR